MEKDNTTTPSNIQIAEAIRKADFKGRIFAGMRIAGMVFLGLGINDLIDQNTKNAQDVALIAEYADSCSQESEPKPQ